MVSTGRIRRVEAADLPVVVEMVHELALYEREPDACRLTVEQLRSALFGPEPALFGHVAEVEGEVAGMALWFLSFSTWRGVHGIYLEDLYVRPTHRGSRLGQRLLAELARECIARGYERLEWTVLDWNEPALGFYRSLGAVGMDGWTVHRVTDDALRGLARIGDAAV